jgi:Family of unknown function (DUF6880)
MARQPALNEEALVKLGSEKLARLVIGEAKRNAAFRKLVAAALAALRTTPAMAAGVTKRLWKFDPDQNPLLCSSYARVPLIGNEAARSRGGNMKRGSISPARFRAICTKMPVTLPGLSPRHRNIRLLVAAGSDHLNESRVKYLTGNDTMSGRDLFESIINFRPTHKPLLRTNHKPKIRGTDLGIWRRIHYWPYIVTIREDEKVVKFRETRLDPERAGILNWMLAGLKDCLAG